MVFPFPSPPLLIFLVLYLSVIEAGFTFSFLDLNRFPPHQALDAMMHDCECSATSVMKREC